MLSNAFNSLYAFLLDCGTKSGYICQTLYNLLGGVMTENKKNRSDIRFEKEAKALKKNLEKRKKQQEQLDNKKKTVETNKQ